MITWKNSMRAAVLLLALCGVNAAENRIETPLVEWKRDFRPANREDLYHVSVQGEETRLLRRPGSNFGRIYHDLRVNPGAVYRVSCRQLTESGALVKLLVIFKGPDGKWREKTRLTDITPLVNGEWSEPSLTFAVPQDVREMRIDYRLDSFGTVLLKDMVLEELTSDAAAAWRKATAVPEFLPGENAGDYALKPGAYYRVAFRAAPEAGREEGRVRMVFHTSDKGFPRDGSLTFYCREAAGKEFREVIVVADNADGIRVTPEGAKVENLQFTEITL